MPPEQPRRPRALLNVKLDFYAKYRASKTLFIALSQQKCHYQPTSSMTKRLDFSFFLKASWLKAPEWNNQHPRQSQRTAIMSVQCLNKKVASLAFLPLRPTGFISALQRSQFIPVQSASHPRPKVLPQWGLCFSAIGLDFFSVHSDNQTLPGIYLLFTLHLSFEQRY